MKKKTIQEKLDEAQGKLDIIMERLTQMQLEMNEMRQMLMPNDYKSNTFVLPHNTSDYEYKWTTTSNGIN